jgi:AbrB family looped-hinge helix DNA binding protein
MPWPTDQDGLANVSTSCPSNPRWGENINFIKLPRAIRRRFNLQEGDRVAFVSKGKEIVLQPLTRTLLDLRGSVPVPQDFDAIRSQVIREHAQNGLSGDRSEFGNWYE